MAVVDGGPVRPHVQAFADEVQRRFGISHIMTYEGHQPTKDRALDNFGTREQMLALAQWTTQDDVIDQYGIDYTMFDVNQTTVGSEIYNREISRSWRQVADRGSPTQNHHDHVHVSFEPTASASPASTPEPAPATHKETEPMIIHAGESLPYPVPNGAKNGLVSCEDFGKGPVKAAIVVGHGPRSFRPAFDAGEEVSVGVGTSKFPLDETDNYIRVTNLDDKGRALTIGVEF